jgi:hypothetical protein
MMMVVEEEANLPGFARPVRSICQAARYDYSTEWMLVHRRPPISGRRLVGPREGGREGAGYRFPLLHRAP